MQFELSAQKTYQVGFPLQLQQAKQKNNTKIKYYAKNSFKKTLFKIGKTF